MQTILHGIEINPKLVAAIFTETAGDILRVFCLYVNGDTHQFEVPLEENQGSINELFTQLDMLDKCSSAIVDQVVQGRIYTQDDKSCWMYTLLATEGSRSPRLQSNIHLLPWKRVWSTKGTEILLLRNRWPKSYCFAVRAEVTEGHLANTIEQCKPFVHPVPPPTRSVTTFASIGALVVAFGLASGVAAWFWQQHKSPMAVSAKPTQKAQVTVETNLRTNYYVLIDRKIQGPLSTASLLQMQQSGAITGETLVRLEGDLDWYKFANMSVQKSIK